jgi:hypothetical protein
MTTRIPGFLADSSLHTQADPHRQVLLPDIGATAEVVAARIVCSTPALGATCTALQAPEWLFPCFGNESCGLFFAGLKLPTCFTCRVV